MQTKEGGLKQRVTLQQIRERQASINPTLEVIETVERKHRNDRILVRCKKCRREWRAHLSGLKNGWGCQTCYDVRRWKAKLLSLEEINRRIDDHTLEVVERSQYHCFLKCKICNHRWKRGWRYIQQNLNGGKFPVICRKCKPHAYSLPEERMRAIIERVTSWKFPKAEQNSLPWLGNMELDGYNERHKVAFEYQGEHHYKSIFGVETLAAIKRRDDKKRKRAQRAGITLIRIPYFKRDVETFILTKLENHVKATQEIQQLSYPEQRGSYSLIANTQHAKAPCHASSGTGAQYLLYQRRHHQH